MSLNTSTPERFDIYTLDETRKYDYRKDTHTNQIYYRKSNKSIKSTCSTLIFFNPVVTVGRVFFSLFNTVYYPIKGLYQLSIQDESWKNSFEKSKEAFTDIFRSAIYGVKLECYAIYGFLFDPLEAQVLYSDAERALNRQEIPNFREKFYSARCFQPIANSNQAGWANRIKKSYKKRRALERALDEEKATSLEIDCVWLGLKDPQDIYQRVGFDSKTCEYNTEESEESMAQELSV